MQKIRVVDRSFQIERIGQLVDIERHLGAIDVDQIRHRFEPGGSDERAEHIRRNFVVEITLQSPNAFRHARNERTNRDGKNVRRPCRIVARQMC